MGGDSLDIVSPSACCECQAAIPPTLPRAKQVSTAAKRLQQRPKVVSEQLAFAFTAHRDLEEGTAHQGVEAAGKDSGP